MKQRSLLGPGSGTSGNYPHRSGARGRLALGMAAAVLCMGLAGSVATAKPQVAGGAGSRAVFERRILPILRAPSPTSCAECHLSGVDLKSYIRPTEAETYASLLKEGLVDAASPKDSKLLKLIRKSTPKSPVISQRARDAEYAAFAEWLTAAAKNGALRTGAARPIGPTVPAAVIRHARRDLVLEAFTRNIWSQEGRCAGCHGKGNATTEKFVKTYGARVAWLIPNDPEATLRQLVAQKMVDTEKPERSGLLLKPLGELGHGGGVKFLPGDRTYKLFLSWLQDYSQTVRGRYLREESLPRPAGLSLVPTGSTLEIVEGPEAWIGKSLRVDLFPWEAQRGDWSATPVASADRAFNRGHGSNLPVFRLVPTGGEEERAAWKLPQLAGGRYLLRFHLGTAEVPAGKATASSELRMEFLGQMEVTSEWKPGKSGATRVRPAFGAKP